MVLSLTGKMLLQKQQHQQQHLPLLKKDGTTQTRDFRESQTQRKGKIKETGEWEIN
jgi:hypothetical protein